MNLIFIVGNSRSGTTMMARILGRHSQVFSLHELHFFGELWDPEKQQYITPEEAKKLLCRLFSIQRDGYLTQGDPQLFLDEACQILSQLTPSSHLTPGTVLASFLGYEAQKNQKTIACEHTPGNIFYIKDILALYPEAKIINMIRDPRDVLLSQKQKWKRRFLGGKIPLNEAIRSKINYHPITISRLWNSAISQGEKYAQHERFYSLKFEELLQNPQQKVQEICEFLAIPFTADLLEVPQIGSSTASDTQKTGIDASKAGNWRKGGLTSTEIYLCQSITEKYRQKYQYEAIAVPLNYLEGFASLLTLPVQLILALCFNINRIGHYRSLIKRHFAINI